MEPHDARCARLIVEAIVADLERRKGLKNEWEEISDEVREQIKHTWYLKALDIVRPAMGG